MTEDMSKFDENSRAILENLHKSFLDTLRKREQEVLAYIIILLPTLGGFAGLSRLDLTEENTKFAFVVGTVGVIFLLLVGALYSLALGYNFRCIALQIAKLESPKCFRIAQYILKTWAFKPERFCKKYCWLPEIIKVFWLAFVSAIFGVSVLSVFNCYIQNVSERWISWVIIFWGTFSLLLSLLSPIYYGNKLQNICKEEVQ